MRSALDYKDGVLTVTVCKLKCSIGEDKTQWHFAFQRSVLGIDTRVFPVIWGKTYLNLNENVQRLEE